MVGSLTDGGTALAIMDSICRRICRTAFEADG
jgi:hypothetical protein